MKLVEIIRGIATDVATYETAVNFAKSLGKTTANAEDFPAFIVNRILVPMINEAIYTLYEGVGTVEAIDTAMHLGANHPMGPLELGDFIGLDTVLSIMNVLHEGLAEFEVPALPAAGEICRGRLAGPQSPAAASTTTAAKSRFRPADFRLNRVRGDHRGGRRDGLRAAAASFRSTRLLHPSDNQLIRIGEMMRKVTGALLAGAYLCLALTTALLIWRGGGGWGAGAAALIGVLALAFALQGTISRALNSGGLRRELDALRDRPPDPGRPAGGGERPSRRHGRERPARRRPPLRGADRRGAHAGGPGPAHERGAGRQAWPRPGRIWRRPRHAQHAALLETVREALADNRVDLYLQPVVSLPQRRTVFYESFSRLRDATGRVHDAGRVPDRGRARGTDLGDRQPAAVPLRADRPPAGQERPQGRHLLQHLPGLAGRRGASSRSSWSSSPRTATWRGR